MTRQNFDAAYQRAKRGVIDDSAVARPAYGKAARVNYHYLYKAPGSWVVEPGGNNPRFKHLGNIGPLRLVWLALTPGPLKKASLAILQALIRWGPHYELGILFYDSGEIADYDELTLRLDV